MYPIERYMKVLEGYTKYQYQLEASILETYVAEKSIEFCFEYIETIKLVGLPQSRHDWARGSKGTRRYNVVTMSR